MSLEKYIRNKKVNHFTISGIEVFVKDEITSQDVSVRSVIQNVVDIIPRYLMRNVESIYVGQFSILKARDFEAVYENSSIFVTNEQESEQDMIDDIIHEVAHSVEELYAQMLYSDGKVEQEFLAKRKNLWTSLRTQGINMDLSLCLDPNYSEEFDNFLYGEVGYQLLSILTSNIYHSAYAATSLREYFADGFEAFFMEDDIPRLKSLCPKLYKKIISLLEN